MTIFFDHQIFSLQNYGGISRYYGELIKEINRKESNNAHLSLLTSNNIHLEELNLKKRSIIAQWNFPRRETLLYKLNQAYSIAQLKGQPFDIFHATYYDNYFTPYLRKKQPSVITFLDMIHERFGHQFKQLSIDRNVIKQKKTIVSQVDKLIAISQSTKNDMVELLDVEPSKIDVIYLGNSLSTSQNKRPELNLDKGHDTYLLYVGIRHLYKNFTLFIHAVAPLLRQYDIRLVCGGGGEFNPEEQQLLNQLRITERVSQEPVDDQALVRLYKGAYAFIFPSLYEGFGIPVLEAFACDCPCIVSTGGSLPEVAGDAALYFDPTDEQAIAVAIQQLLDDNALRDQLINRGRQQRQLFSWQKTASETVASYQSLL